MASNYADGMPDGLTFKSEQQKQDLTYNAVDKAQELFKTIGKQLGTHNAELQEELLELAKQQQKLYKRFDEEQAQRSMDAKLLKQKGASDEEIIAYLSKRQDTYEKDTKALFDSFGNLHRTLEGWIEEDENLSGEDRVLLRKQLETFQKSYDLDEQLRQENEKDKKKRNAVLDHIAESVRGTWKEALENGKEERKDAFGSMAASLLGPLRVIADPIAKFATGKTTKDLAQDIFEKVTSKKDKEEEKAAARDLELESALSTAQEPLVTSVSRISDLIETDLTPSLPAPEAADSVKNLFVPQIESENSKKEPVLALPAPVINIPDTSIEVPPAEAPRIEIPSIEVPAPEASESPEVNVSIPEMATPEVVNNITTETPEVAVDTPEVMVPEISVPKIDLPKIDAPEVMVPEISVPKIDAPEVMVPEIDTPEVFNSINVPDISSPEVRVDAPQVEVPEEKPIPLSEVLERLTINADLVNLISEGKPELSEDKEPENSFQKSFVENETVLLPREPEIFKGIESSSDELDNSLFEKSPLAPSVSTDESLLNKTTPVETELLRKGGIIGASAVFLGKEIRKLGEGIDDIDLDGEDESFLDKLSGGKFSKTLTKLAPTLASAAGVAAVAAVPIAMLVGGAKLQERDTEDAKKYAEQGEYGRAVETAWLGDRSRLTEENANAELGRATGKTALIAGGAAGVTALAAGGAAAGMAAGGAAAAGGAGLLGTGLAAAGAAAGSVFPPVLIAAAIAAAVTVVAKGTQEAFELGWDKNQAEIQKNLYDTIYSEDSSVWEKIKASVESGWKEFTGTLAGGIRGASEELEGDAAIEWQRGIEYLEKTAAEGNEENARLLTMLQSEEFKALSDKDQEMILKSEGLFDEYQTMLDEAQNSFGESLLNGLRATGDFFKGAINTKMEAFNGKRGAAIDAKLLKDMDKITGEDVERLKNSTAYAEALSQGKNKKQAMEAAYLDEKHKENAALGIQKENGVAVGFNDYAVTYFQKKKTDEDYRQTHEYSQEKAKLMQQGYTSEEADLKAIQEYNEMYEQALTYRLKQTKDYREHYKKCLKEGKSMAQAEKEALRVAKENTRNTMTVTELIKDKFSSIGTSLKETFNRVGEKISEGFDTVKESDFVKTISEFATGIWDSVTEWFGKIGNWFSEKWDSITEGLATAWDSTKEGFKTAGDWISDKATAAGDWVGDKASAAWSWITGSKPDAQIEDGIVTKDGKVIQLSPEDNVYATKNMPTVVGDADAQRAMPSVPTPQAEFTDKGIIAAIQVLTEVLKNKNMSPEISIPDNSTVGFDQYRSA